MSRYSMQACSHHRMCEHCHIHLLLKGSHKARRTIRGPLTYQLDYWKTNVPPFTTIMSCAWPTKHHTIVLKIVESYIHVILKLFISVLVAKKIIIAKDDIKKIIQWQWAYYVNTFELEIDSRKQSLFPKPSAARQIFCWSFWIVAEHWSTTSSSCKKKKKKKKVIIKRESGGKSALTFTIRKCCVIIHDMRRINI